MTAPKLTPSTLTSPLQSNPSRVALAHDWLTGMRGGERTLEAICELFPNAERFSLLHVPRSVSTTIESRPIHTSFVQHLPFSSSFYRFMLPLFPAAVEQFDLDEFDVIISTSHCAAKSVIPTGRARHLSYCFTPMRYAWDQFNAYFGPDRVGRMANRGLRWGLSAMARWDASTACRVHRYVAISQYVASRIRRYYNRAATVVYPPVDTAFFVPNGEPPADYALVVSALVPYKRIDLAIRACRLARVPLRVVGTGPDLRRLRALSTTAVEFLADVSDQEVRRLFQNAAVVLLPGTEDFGIAPVEAQACGRPVVALRRGGACETVVDGLTGALVPEATAGAFAEAINRVIQARLDPHVIRKHALQFSRERFHVDFRRQIYELMLDTGKRVAS